MTQHAAEVASGERFEFGKNWTAFLAMLDDRRIAAAEQSLREMLEVYSWGVLHHTGQMWKALEHAGQHVKEGWQLFIAIYNDQGTASKRWLWVKRLYNRSPAFLRPPLLWLVFIHTFWRRILKDTITFHFFETFRPTTTGRGMSVWRDLVDWVGGYPFEVAKPEELFDFYKARGFQLEKMKTCNDLGCNELIFRLSRV